MDIINFSITILQLGSTTKIFCSHQLVLRFRLQEQQMFKLENR